MNLFNKIPESRYLDGAPQGVDQLLVDALSSQQKRQIIILRDDARLTQFCDGFSFVNPDCQMLQLPAWDCLPYDRVSPHSAVTSTRLASLSSLAGQPKERLLVVTTVNGWLQRVPPPSFFANASLALSVGQEIAIDDVVQFLAQNGFHRTDTVREYGEFAVRGSLVDIYPMGTLLPFRLDLLDDEIECQNSPHPLSVTAIG